MNRSRANSDSQQPIDKNEIESDKRSKSQNRKSIQHINGLAGVLATSPAGSIGEDDESKIVESDDGLEDDMMDKISSSPSIEDEEIDNEFVYALHTFIATVEGQANATKGDTMVLLDDSNSYWWLVRVVKDCTIGYLPAEHIETPTERLARLNKHRNIDLSSEMLGDQTEKHQNPLKKAFRKRGTKTVAFADPTYVEASDNDYSTEGDDEGQELGARMISRDHYGDDYQENHNDDNVSVEPLKSRTIEGEAEANVLNENSTVTANNSTDRRASEELAKGSEENNLSDEPELSTDSIFRDDSAETKKITLTPNLLRDNSSPSDARVSNEIRVSSELRDQKRPSLESLDRESPERGKEKKERNKEKKSGMLSGLFKRRDRKNKSVDEDLDDVFVPRQSSNEISRVSSEVSKDLDESSEVRSVQSQDMQVQTSKLQSNATSRSSPVRNTLQSNEPKSPDSSVTAKNETVPKNVVISDTTTDATTLERDCQLVTTNKISIAGTKKPILDVASLGTNLDDSKMVNMLKSTESPANPEGIGSITKTTPSLNTRLEVNPSENHQQTGSTGGLNVKHSVMPVENSSPDEASSSVSPISPKSPSIGVENTRINSGPSSVQNNTSKIRNNTQLRSFFDDGTDIRDLLIIVYDNSGVVPAGPEHPITRKLFKEENAKLADLALRLDGMLESWLARKSLTRGARS